MGLGDFLGKLFGGGKVKATPADLKADFPINEWMVETDSSGNEIMYQIGGWNLDKVLLNRKGTKIKMELTREEMARRGLSRAE